MVFLPCESESGFIVTVFDRIRRESRQRDTLYRQNCAVPVFFQERFSNTGNPRE
jgi:hypothetical protein